MPITTVLLILLGGAFLVPLLGGDDDDDDGKNEILRGSNDDEVQGTEGNDLIRTFLGNDTIFGNGGNDEIRSGEDDDYIEGGDGLDFVRAGAGNDEVYGNDQNDRLFGDQGDDYLDGGRGEDVIRGGRGNDLIFGGSDNLDGQADVLSGEDDSDTIFAWGNGSILNGGQNDVDNPGDNDDTLVMVTGEGTMENRTGENTNIGLANVGDSQETIITVTDFSPTDDTLVLTVDYATSDGADVTTAPDFTVSYAFEPATETTGAGMRITVTWDNPEGDVTDQESASAFLLGITESNAASLGLDPDGGTLDPDDPDAPIDVDVFLTNEASLTDPLSTMNQIGINTLAMQAWP